MKRNCSREWPFQHYCGYYFLITALQDRDGRCLLVRYCTTFQKFFGLEFSFLKYFSFAIFSMFVTLFHFLL